MRTIIILLVLLVCGCHKSEDGQAVENKFKPSARKVSMELVKFTVTGSNEIGNWRNMLTGERVVGPLVLSIHVIGKTAQYSLKDSIIVSSEQVEITQEPIMTPSYIPFGYDPQYKTVTTKIPANIGETFNTVCFPQTTKAQLELRLKVALLNKEWVTFILKTENDYAGERCYGIEFSREKP